MSFGTKSKVIFLVTFEHFWSEYFFRDNWDRIKNKLEFKIKVSTQVKLVLISDKHGKIENFYV